MKLNLDVCQKCCSHHTLGIAFGDNSKEMITKRGWIRCPRKMETLIKTKLKKKPPDWCEYKLEHAVSEIVNIDKG